MVPPDLLVEGLPLVGVAEVWCWTPHIMFGHMSIGLSFTGYYCKMRLSLGLRCTALTLLHVVIVTICADCMNCRFHDLIMVTNHHS